MPINTLDPANSVLFLGSGFSAGATNIAGEKVPIGHPLLERLAAALDEDVKNLELKSAADEFLSRNDLSLYDLLYETFTISNPLSYQNDIISLPWARIYTTNYDDIVSVVRGPNFPLFTFDEPRPRRLPPAFAVHLHGSIRRANEQNADDQLILNSRSYDVITSRHLDWFHEFQRDRRTFEACYFMGFSLNDHHITGLMTSGEESVKRTYFVSRKDPRPSFVRRASDYGEVVPIGFEAFADLAKTLPKPERPQDIGGLQSFKYLRPGLDSKTLAGPTPVEIINLVRFGTFSQSRFFNTPTEHGYVAERAKPVEATLEALQGAKTALVHSRLGNGKTIFTSILALKAAAAGYACLLWRRAGRNLAQDLETISAQKRVLVIFDDYDAAIENIERVAAGVPNAKFVVTVRTGQQEVRFHEIVQRLPAPMKRVNLNVLSDHDREQLLSILHRAGAQVDGLEQTVNSAREIRDIVTQLYNHAEISQKIHAAVGNAPPAVTQIIVLASLIKWTGAETDDGYLQELTGRDVYAELRKAEAFVNDFLDVHDDKVEMRSSLLSEFFIQRIFTPKEILDGCYDITTSSTRRKIDRAHRRLSGELMKFSTLQRFLKFYSDSDEALNRHYVRLSNDKDVNAEPLFWLQYAILMKTSGDLPNARMFLNAGYERASRLVGFKTYQLDTQALSIYLLEETARKGLTVEGLSDILKSIKTVTDMIADLSHRHHAIEVLGEVPIFVNARRAALTEPEKIALIFDLNRAAQALAALSVGEQAYTESEIVRTQLEAAVATLAH
jgi:hypothetical protein